MDLRSRTHIRDPLILVPGDVLDGLFLQMVRPQVIGVNDLLDFHVCERPGVFAATPRGCTALEFAARLMTGWISELEATPVEAESKTQLLRLHIITPEEIEGLLDLSKIGVGKDIVADRIRCIPDAVQTVNMR